MKAIVYLLLIALLPAICLLGWISFPLSPSVPGLYFPLLTQLDPRPQLSFLSYGSCSALLILLCAYALRRGNQRFACVAAATLLLLVESAPLQVAFGNVSLLERLAREADWQQGAIQFSTKFLPANLGSEAMIWPTLPLNTVAERLIAGWYFMGLGWYMSLVSGLVLMASALNNVALRSRMRLALLMGVELFLPWVFFLNGAFAAQHALTEGALSAARGDLVAARRHYLEAQHYDPWDRLRIDFRARLGAVDASLGRTGSQDAHIFVAEQMIDRRRSIEAITEYQKLATSDAEVAAVARTRLSDLWVDEGLRFYEVGSFGRAVDAWRQALAYDPSNYLAGFCLTRGYFAIGMYHEAADIAGKFSNASDPVFRANLYCNWADAQIRDGALPAAHIAYKRAYDWDYAFNRRALQSTVGP